MPNFRITNRAANHRRKEDGAWRHYGYGSEISLTEEQFKSGRYNHLRLVPLFGTELKDSAPAQEPDETPENENGTDDVTKDDADADEDALSDETGPGNDQAITVDQLNELIDRVEESKVGDGTFDSVRADIEELGIFDELPDTKTGVLETLKARL